MWSLASCKCDACSSHSTLPLDNNPGPASQLKASMLTLLANEWLLAAMARPHESSLRRIVDSFFHPL